MTDPAAQPAATPLSASDDKLWASLAHLGGILYILPSLLIWLILKDRGPKVNVEAKEALNWQITFLIGEVILWILSGILGVALAFTPVSFLGLLFFWLPGIWWIINVIFSILGFVAVNNGGSYRYPINVRFIK